MLAIVNPTSGGGAGVRMPAELQARLHGAGSDSLEVRVTERTGHATELARDAALSGQTSVIAVGGDGTIHEVANGLLQARETDANAIAVLGVVPIGTGNDFVKMLEGTARRDEAYATIHDGEIHHVDAGLATWDGGREYFVNAAGTGIDVEVVRMLGIHRGTRGPMDYVVALVRALRRYRAIPLSITSDGGRLDLKTMIVAVGNGRCVGGTFRICPEARVDDGQFEVCAVADMGIGRSIGTAARIVRGTHANAPGVESFRAEWVELTVPEGTALFFQLDGELREPASARTIRLDIRKGILPVYARGLVSQT